MRSYLEDQELRVHFRRILRSWELAQKRLHMPSDVKEIIEFADAYFEAMMNEVAGDS
jgi:hypothetical protein